MLFVAFSITLLGGFADVFCFSGNQTVSGEQKVTAISPFLIKDVTVDGGASIVEENISADGTTVTFKVSFSAPGKATSTVTFKAPVPFLAGTLPQDEIPPDDVTHEFTVVEIDLDVDSDNNNLLATPDENDTEDYMEANPELPGKFVLANTLDRTGNGNPDFVDGMSIDGLTLFGESGAEKSNEFTPMKVTIQDFIDLATAKVKFTYSESRPDSSTITKTDADPENNIPFDTYTIDYGKLRIWKKDGDKSRDTDYINSDSTPGDFVAEGQDYDASDVFGTGHSVTLYIEGINESTKGEVEVKVELDPDGSGNYICEDIIRVTVAEVQLVYTDITGINGIGNTPYANVPHIAIDQEPDGIACDGLIDVDDGAQLLLRIAVTEALYDELQSGTHPFSFGYINPDSGNFEALPTTGDKQEGEYLSNMTDSILSGKSIEKTGDTYNSTKKIISFVNYKPPVEFDLEKPRNTESERKLNLAIDFSTIVNAVGTKPNGIYLVRPPLVLIHGINATSVGKNAWAEQSDGSVTFRGHFEEKGYIMFSVDHNTIYNGNGDIHESYKFLMNMIFEEPSSSDYYPGYADDSNSTISQGTSAKKSYNDGLGFDGKTIAIQKCDLLAHSYGGLLSRWYAEQSLEYPNRKDLRKLITMGTPHRGTTCTPMMCEIYNNPLLYHAKAGIDLGFLNKNDALEAGTLFHLLNKPSDAYWAFGDLAAPLGLFDLPDSPVVKGYKNSSRAGENGDYDEDIVPALQVMTFNSRVLRLLNDTPFNDEIAYASITGIDEGLILDFTSGDWAQFINVNKVAEPYYNETSRNPFLISPIPPQWGVPLAIAFNADNNRSYFPWLKMDQGDGKSDAIVPIWSQRLSKKNHPVDETHLTYNKSSETKKKLCEWLSDPDLPKGAAHRLAWANDESQIEYFKSRKNIFLGAELNPATEESHHGGVNPDSIVKIEYVVQGNQNMQTVDDIPTLNKYGGLIEVKMTGMLRNDTHKIDLVQEGGYWDIFDSDTVLISNAIAQKNLNATNSNIEPTAQLIAFRKSFFIGKKADGFISTSIAGPDGSDSNHIGENVWLIGYHIKNLDFYGFTGKSPPAYIGIEVMDDDDMKPAGPSSVSYSESSYTLKGGFSVTPVADSIQVQEIRVGLYDENLLLDTLLTEIYLNLIIPVEAFPDLMLPYETTLNLRKDFTSYVAGHMGSSEESEAEIYQRLTNDDETLESSTISVTAE